MTALELYVCPHCGGIDRYNVDRVCPHCWRAEDSPNGPDQSWGRVGRSHPRPLARKGRDPP